MQKTEDYWVLSEFGRSGGVGILILRWVVVIRRVKEDHISLAPETYKGEEHI